MYAPRGRKKQLPGTHLVKEEEFLVLEEEEEEESHTYTHCRWSRNLLGRSCDGLSLPPPPGNASTLSAARNDTTNHSFTPTPTHPLIHPPTHKHTHTLLPPPPTHTHTYVPTHPLTIHPFLYTLCTYSPLSLPPNLFRVGKRNAIDPLQGLCLCVPFPVGGGILGGKSSHCAVTNPRIGRPLTDVMVEALIFPV